jgi:CheY-like chemotaxis protein
MKKKRILVVDDEPSVTRLLKLNLEQTGDYEVRELNAGANAVKIARDFKPDLVLLDVMLPDMDGGEVAAALKKDSKLKKTPIVFLTAAVNEAEVQANKGRIGGFPFIAKPLHIKNVIEAVEANLVV